MHSFLKRKLESFALSNGLAALLVRTAKEEGGEGELDRLELVLVEKLKKSSIITSAVASCAIEGINVSEAQATALIDKHITPGRREEREVLNYKDALDYLFNTPISGLRPTPELLRTLHRLAMAGSAHAGTFKTRDNSIIERTDHGDRLRFTPVSFEQTEQAIESLCLSYNEAINKETAAPQVCVAALVLDFTCVHPFLDGNGRVSRLLTTAALLEQGLKMPRLVALEEIIQNRDNQYYAALKASSEGWHTGNHDLAPFLRFHLETIAAGYEDLRLKITRIKEPVTVVFDDLIAPEIREKAFEEFQKIYESASWKTDNLRKAARKITIEGYKPTADTEVFEKLRHANRLAERCLQDAETQGISGRPASFPDAS
jgi:Fic family protein